MRQKDSTKKRGGDVLTYKVSQVKKKRSKGITDLLAVLY